MKAGSLLSFYSLSKSGSVLVYLVIFDGNYIIRLHGGKMERTSLRFLRGANSNFCFIAKKLHKYIDKKGKIEYNKNDEGHR